MKSVVQRQVMFCVTRETTLICPGQWHCIRKLSMGTNFFVQNARMRRLDDDLKIIIMEIIQWQVHFIDTRDGMYVFRTITVSLP